MYAQNAKARNLLQFELPYSVVSRERWISSSRLALLGFLNNVLQRQRSSNIALVVQDCCDLQGYFDINSHNFQHLRQVLKFPVVYCFAHYVWSYNWRVKPSISTQTQNWMQNFMWLLSDNWKIFRTFGYQKNIYQKNIINLNLQFLTL